MGFSNKFCQTCRENVANYFTICPSCQTPLIDRPTVTPYQHPDYTKRPLGIVIIIVLLCIGTLFDLTILASESDLLLIAVFIFRLIAIVGLAMMTSWGYWLVIALYSFQILLGFADKQFSWKTISE